MDFTSLFGTQEILIALQLTAAMSLGMLLGAERTMAGKTAGMRTHALVCMASTLYTSLSVLFVTSNPAFSDIDPFRVVGGIVTGIGFIGAGIIMFKDATLRGITTAAGIWVTSAIGVALGLGFYIIAVVATLLTLFVFRVLWMIENRLKVAWDAHEPTVVEDGRHPDLQSDTNS